MDSQKVFDHERLDVFRVAIEFMSVANDMTKAVPRGYSSVADQLKRSAAESAAALSIFAVIGSSDRERVEAAREKLHRIVSMLVKLSQ